MPEVEVWGGGGHCIPDTSLSDSREYKCQMYTYYDKIKESLPLFQYLFIKEVLLLTTVLLLVGS